MIDLALLTDLLHDERLTDTERDAFEGMQVWLVGDENRTLSTKQRNWVKDVAARLDVSETSLNLVSNGLVPRGNEVPTPEVLRYLPKRPPGR